MTPVSHSNFFSLEFNNFRGRRDKRYVEEMSQEERTEESGGEESGEEESAGED